MTQDEIIEMARQARLMSEYDEASPWVEDHEITEYVVAFAKLVDLRYQKKIAELKHIICQHHWDVLQEREACAKVCDNHQYVHPYHDLGTLVRARGGEA